MDSSLDPKLYSFCTPASLIPDCRTVDSVRASRWSPLTAAGAETAVGAATAGAAAPGAEAAGRSASASAVPARSADSADSRC